MILNYSILSIWDGLKSSNMYRDMVQLGRNFAKNHGYGTK